MAELIRKQWVDDLAHRAGQEIEASETIEFAFDGSTYRIDLGVENAERLRSVFAEFIEAAQCTTPKGRGKGRDDEARRQRAWAGENGYDVKDRGRIPKKVQEAWRATRP